MLSPVGDHILQKFNTLPSSHMHARTVEYARDMGTPSVQMHVLHEHTYMNTHELH